MKYLLCLGLALSFATAFAQPKTVAYFDKNWQKVSKANAYYYRTVEPAGSKFHVRDNYMSGQLQMECICDEYEPKLKWDAVSTLFYANGKKAEEGPFRNEARYGVHTYWYEDGSKQKVMEHDGNKNLYREFWSKKGKPLLVGGTGTIHETLGGRDITMDIENSSIATSYDVRAKNDTVYMALKTPAEYKGGGLPKLVSEIQSKLHLPMSAQRAGIAGRVYVGFVIDKTGAVRDPYIVRGISKDCDDEAIKVVKSLTRWRPGYLGNKAVNCMMVVPVDFKR